MPNARAAVQRGAGISVDAVVNAAEQLADVRGLDGVSLRGVAAELGVTPMALYRYVSTKDELIDLLVDRLVERSVEEVIWPRDWAEVLRIVARSTRSLMLEHPVVLASCLRRAMTMPSANSRLDRTLGALVGAGLPRLEAVAVYSNLFTLAVGYAALESGRAQAVSAAGHTAEDERDRMAAALLENGELHHVEESLPDLLRLVSDEFFVAGVERIIRSVRAQL